MSGSGVKEGWSGLWRGTLPLSAFGRQTSQASQIGSELVQSITEPQMAHLRKQAMIHLRSKIYLSRSNFNYSKLSNSCHRQHSAPVGEERETPYGSLTGEVKERTPAGENHGWGSDPQPPYHRSGRGSKAEYL